MEADDFIQFVNDVLRIALVMLPEAIKEQLNPTFRIERDGFVENGPCESLMRKEQVRGALPRL